MGTRPLAVVGMFAITAWATLAAASAQRGLHDQHVLVGVLDAHGAPVVGLTPADIEIREDGAPREVLRVTPAPPPSDIALLIDTSAAAQPLVAELHQGAETFLHGVLRFDPVPKVTIVTLGGRPDTIVPATIEPAILERGLAHLFPQSDSGAYLMDGIVETAHALEKHHADAPVIVAVAIDAGREFSTADHDAVTKALQAAQASLWTVVLQSRNETLESIPARERATVETDVTAASGGTTHEALSKVDIEPALAQIVSAIAARYDVVYARPDGLIPPRERQVRAKRSDVTVAASSWTTAP